MKLTDIQYYLYRLQFRHKAHKGYQKGLFFCLLLIFTQTGRAQPQFFLSDWEPKSIEAPEYVQKEEPPFIPSSLVEVDAADTIRKISPYIGGYNLNTYYGGKIYNKPRLLENIRRLDLPFFRYPGGSGSNWYFWNHSKPNGPEDVNFFIARGEREYNKFKWGEIPGADYLGLDNYYHLRDSVGNRGIHVINYSYARYGRSEHPVQKAAHYAANWVRYDNGRTRFWEIGNEHYGSWEAGYEIDTSENKDGQPMILDG